MRHHKAEAVTKVLALGLINQDSALSACAYSMCLQHDMHSLDYNKSKIVNSVTNDYTVVGTVHTINDYTTSLLLLPRLL
jgi:hypothetical protein